GLVSPPGSRVRPRLPLLHQREPRPDGRCPGEVGGEKPLALAEEEAATSACRFTAVPAGGGRGDDYSWTATGRLRRSERCRGSSTMPTLSCSSGSVRATTETDTTAPRLTGRCGVPGGTYMKSPARTMVRCTRPSPCQTSVSPLTV